MNVLDLYREASVTQAAVYVPRLFLQDELRRVNQVSDRLGPKALRSYSAGILEGKRELLDYIFGKREWSR